VIQIDANTDGLDGLRIRLSEATRPAAGPTEANPRAEISVLPPDRTKRLLDRLPPIQRAEQVDFKLRAGSPPPPLPGSDVQTPWPPPQRPEVAPGVEPGEFRVTRSAPEGKIPLAPHVSVSFSHPMVAVTSQDEAAKTVPVRIDPQPEGKWRWLGTKTVLFDPAVRMPMATRYTVTVPKGTPSAVGGRLAADHTFQFETPPPTLQTQWPSEYGTYGTDTLVVVGFDQKVDERILDFVKVRGGGADVPVQTATAEQVANKPEIRDLTANLVPGRFLVLAPKTRLLPSTSYQVVVAKGAPSAEGPLPTPQDQSWTFNTYDPLRTEEWGCWNDRAAGACNPDGNLWVRLNNELVADGQDDQVVVEPALPGQRIQIDGSWVHIYGKLPPRSTVKVTLKAALKDVYGQALGQNAVHTFRIGTATPQLQGSGGEQVVLDPASPGAYSVYSRNHRSLDVGVYQVQPSDFAALSRWFREARYDGAVKEPPLQRLSRAKVTVDGFVEDELVETRLDLAKYLQGGNQVLLWIQPPSQPVNRWERVDVFAWVQQTRLGLTTFVDGQELLAWVTDLQTGAPVPDADVSLLGASQGAARTDASGLARLGPYGTSSGPHALLAKKGEDQAVLPAEDSWWNEYGSWNRRESPQELRWMVFDDRAMYKPKEEVRVKGFVRGFSPKPGAGLMPFDGTKKSLSWRAFDAQGAPLGDGVADVSPLGGFDFLVKLPDTPNLGYARIDLDLPWTGSNTSHSHGFQIQEFRRPEYQVKTSVDPRPYVLGEHAVASVEASYYAGGALPNADTSWSVTATPASFSPPGHVGYQFGPYTPWWMGEGGFGRYGSFAADASGETFTFAGKTGADGTHSLKMEFLAMKPARPYAVRAEAAVYDVNRQRWSSSAQLLVHPADRYVGVKPQRTFVEAGKALEVDLIVVDLDGKVQVGVPIEATFSRREWQKVAGTWQEVDLDPQPCAVVSAADPVRCTITPTLGGSWRLTAKVRDNESRVNETSTTLWVSGGKVRPDRSVSQQEVQLIPAFEQGEPGKDAEILVQAPFYPATGIVTIRQDGILSTSSLQMDGPSTTLKVPIDERMVPNVTLEVDLVGSAERTDDDGKPLPDKARRPAYASGRLEIKVPPLSRTLGLQLKPAAAQVDPGSATHVDVELIDAGGRPVVGAEVAVWMVDEAVLALSNYQVPDPLSVFYASRGDGVSEAHLRSRIVLDDPAKVSQNANKVPGGMGGLGGSGYGRGGGGMAEAKSVSRSAADGAGAPPPMPAPMAAAPAEREEAPADALMAEPEAPSGQQASSAAIELREDFRALAIFAPRVSTDAQGRARIPVTLPDSLTRYRVMAVAVDARIAFGSAESTLTARKPLMLRPSPPRFLNVGDRAELPFVVQNPTNRPVTVDLALRVDNGKVLDRVDVDLLSAPDRTDAGFQFVVPAEDRRELRIPVGVVTAGTLRFQAAIASADATDAATLELPVYTPATTEAFATYGTFDKGGMVQPILAPPDAWTQYGGLEITTSSTQLQALTDALLYLNQYPFECTEQIASRMLANAALRDVLSAFEAEGLPSPEALRASVEADLARLGRRQLPNGGFSYWGTSPDVPFASLHAVHAMVRAKEKGWAVDPTALSRGLDYAKNIERHLPSWYSEQARRTVRAYAVSIQHQAGSDSGGDAKRLADFGTAGLSLEAQGWIVPALYAKKDPSVDVFLRHWANRLTETAGQATFAESYTDTADYVLLHGSRRTDGVLLDTLLQVRPKDEVVPKIVRGLLGHQKKGRWSSTQENTFVLLSMDRYFRVYEGVTPNFVARAWLDDGFIAERAFRGRSTERAHTQVPMEWLAERAGERKLTLAMEGEGRLYYRVGLRYAPKDLQLPAADYGFAVQRRYEGVDNPSDVRQDPDGTWRVKAGARVRVRVDMVAPSRRTMVALVDPLPAGFEAMNPALAVTGTVPASPDEAKSLGPYWWWWGPWYSHQNLRDERVEAFTELLYAGEYQYEYVALATTPGRYVVPGSKAEQMYEPETFGRGATASVIIE
jgi:hypothetical protein